MAKIDFKKTALEHVEKGIFGVIVLVILLGLASTRWSPYDGTPREITEGVKRGRETLYRNTWPEEEKEKYTLTREDIPANVVNQHLVARIDPTPFEVSTKINSVPWAGNEPVREPVLLAPEDLLASSARVLIHIGPKREEKSETEEETKLAAAEQEMDDDSIPDEFRQRRAGAGAGGMMGNAGGGYEDYAVELGYEYDDAGSVDFAEEGEYGYLGLGGGEGPAKPKLEGEGHHFVSVRAVFNVREQIRKYADAIHRSYHEASRVFDIIDFELQRQTRQPGEDPWSGPWEPVDINAAYDVLERANGFEPDVVNSMVTNSVITMPLPARISGQWRQQATHRRIEKFELSDNQIALEMELTRGLLQEAVEQRKQFREETVVRGGFSNLQFDRRQLQADLMDADSMYDMEYSGGGGMGGRGMTGARPGSQPRGNPNDPLEKLIKKMAEGSAKPKEQEDALRKWIKEGVSVEGELMLFRYFDFSVEPGKTYRYRVRFVLNNPNFGRRITDAGGLEHVVAGQTRTTDWSNVTGAVRVEEDVRYFLSDVRRMSIRMLPSARMDVFQWDPKYGTTMNGRVEVQLGQKIGDTIETSVINPAEHKFENQKYPFFSDAYLVDALEDLEFDDEFHGGERVDAKYRLELPRGYRGRLHLLDEALVKSEEGELRVLDPARFKREHERLKTYQKYQAEAFEKLKAKKRELADAEYGEFYEDEMMYEEMGGGRGRRSYLRKGRAGRGSMP